MNKLSISHKILNKLWGFGFTDLTKSEVEAIGRSSCSLDTIPKLLSAPKFSVSREVFGRINNAEWLLTDGATRKAAVFLVRQAKRSQKYNFLRQQMRYR